MNKALPTPAYHAAAVFTLLIWGSTFIASKVLLEVFTPIQVIAMRYLIAYFVLLLLHPRAYKTSLRQEGRFLLLALFGCTLYSIGEYNALLHTLTSNVSIIVSAAPIFTAVLAHFALKQPMKKQLWLGFLIAFSGVALVVFNGAVVLKLNPSGDMLALFSAMSWAVYSIMLTRFTADMHPLYLNRKIMLYAFLTALPAALMEHKPYSPALLLRPELLFNLLFLGILGSGVCFVLWSLAMRGLGVVRANNYIYAIPFVTMLAARLFLGEPITIMGLAGAVLIVCGVFVCNRKERSEE